jgi:hypothetical protein
MITFSSSADLLSNQQPVRFLMNMISASFTIIREFGRERIRWSKKPKIVSGNLFVLGTEDVD